MTESLHLAGQLVHVFMALLALSALYSLKVAKRENKHLWAPWVSEVWWIHALFVFAALQRSAELYFRGSAPTVAVAFVFVALIWTVHRIFGGKLYKCSGPAKP